MINNRRRNYHSSQQDYYNSLFASYFEQFDKRKFFPDRTGRGANGKLRETETCVYIEQAREIETSSWVLVKKGKCSKRHYKRLGFVYEVCISSLLLRFSKKNISLFTVTLTNYRRFHNYFLEDDGSQMPYLYIILSKNNQPIMA